MKINRSVYDKIFISQNERPPETGGILGGIDDVITTTFFDVGMQTGRMCSYIPNVKVLNKVIKEWKGKGIYFKGIYHTHFWGNDTLSDADKKYIEQIMRNISKKIVSLYFPLIIMPEKKIACYKATLIKGKLVIELEEIEIIYNGGTKYAEEG